MKLLKLSIFAATAAVVAGTASVAHAGQVDPPLNGYYYFTGTSDSSPGGYAGSADGSYVVFDNNVLESWYLTDEVYVRTVDGVNQYYDLVLDTANSHVYGIYGYASGQNAWEYTFQSDTPDIYGDPTMSASNDSIGAQPSYAALYADPNGYWTVPDSSSTMGLFAGALTGLGICSSFLRRKAAKL